MKQTATIQDNSLFYNSLRPFLRGFFHVYFRHFAVRGLENLPANEPVLVAANHQAGLIDPLAIILAQNEPIVYMARADIFRQPLVARMLRKLKIMPVYRIRDGYESLSKNEEQFREAVGVLMDKKRLGVMPEGNHGEQHCLRPLVKGLFRIAFRAEMEWNQQAHVRIVPVGIDLSAYQHAGADLTVTIGKPIEVNDFLERYTEDPTTGINALREATRESLSHLMHDVRSTDYERTYRLSCLGVPAYLETFGAAAGHSSKAFLRSDARAALGRHFDQLEKDDPEEMEALDRLTERIKQLPVSVNETTEMLTYRFNAGWWIYTLTVGLLVLPGFLLNLPAQRLGRALAGRLEDPQMYHTFAWVSGIVLFGLEYTALAAGLVLFGPLSAVKGGLLLLALGVLGTFSEKGRQALRTRWATLPYLVGKRRGFLKTCSADYETMKHRIQSGLRADRQ
jgi:1-acyl-sn-glycerol-3-phosphate acyltransferase